MVLLRVYLVSDLPGLAAAVAKRYMSFLDNKSIHGFYDELDTKGVVLMHTSCSMSVHLAVYQASEHDLASLALALSTWAVISVCWLGAGLLGFVRAALVQQLQLCHSYRRLNSEHSDPVELQQLAHLQQLAEVYLTLQ